MMTESWSDGGGQATEDIGEEGGIGKVLDGVWETGNEVQMSARNVGQEITHCMLNCI